MKIIIVLIVLIARNYCNAAVTGKKLYHVSINLTKYGLSPIFTHEIPFINFCDFYLYPSPPLPPLFPVPKVMGNVELKERDILFGIPYSYDTSE